MRRLVVVDRNYKNSSEVLNVQIQRHRKATRSRYKNILVMNYGSGEHAFATVYPEDIEIDEDTSYKIYTLRDGEEGRLDLVAYTYYRDPSLFWVIAEFNGISDPFEVEAGTTLLVPSISVLYGRGGILS